jgi:DNA-binding response OmpR family regulator
VAPCASSDSQPERQLVLIVDQSDLICNVVRRILEAHDFRVLVVDTPRAALASVVAIRDHPIDAMIAELTISAANGFDFSRELTQLAPGLPVLLMSGCFRARDPEILERIGPGRAFIAKPFTQASLLSKLGSVIDETRACAS